MDDWAPRFFFGLVFNGGKARPEMDRHTYIHTTLPGTLEVGAHIPPNQPKFWRFVLKKPRTG